MSTPADRNYTNDRREGRTNPDLVEIIDRTDARHRYYGGPRYRPNRADRRARGGWHAQYQGFRRGWKKKPGRRSPAPLPATVGA